MSHRDRAGDPPGWRGAAGDAGHRQGFPTPSGGSPARPERRLAKAFGRPMLVDGAHGLRCSTLASAKPPAEPGSPCHALLAENLGEPSLGAIIKDLWYNAWD